MLQVKDIVNIYKIDEVIFCSKNVSHQTIIDKMAEWKQDMATLHQRFDLDNNGELSMQEWMLARKAARREAEKRVAGARAQPDTHYLLQPHDGRLFLISNLPQNRLARRYWFWTWAHLAIFLGALSGLSWLLAPHAG